MEEAREYSTLSCRNYYKNADPEFYAAVLKSFEVVGLSFPKLWKKYLSKPDVKSSELYIPSAYRSILGNQFLLIDSCRLWYDALLLELIARVLARSEDWSNTELDSRNKVALSMCLRVSADADAIKLLVSKNLDVQAKALARGTSEAHDVLLLSIDDEQFCAEMIERNDIDVAKGFWFEKIAKGKLKKRMRENIRLLQPGLEDIYDYFEEEEGFLGLSVHASYLSGMMGLLSGFDSHNPVGMSDAVSPNSVRTLSYIIHRMSFSVVVLDSHGWLNTLSSAEVLDSDEHCDIVGLLGSGASIALTLILLERENRSRSAILTDAEFAADA